MKILFLILGTKSWKNLLINLSYVSLDMTTKEKKKKLNFKIQKYNKKKINYIVLETKFPIINNAWQNQAFQRDYMLKALNYLDENDYIFFSDPDEIIRPKFLQDFNLKKKIRNIFTEMFQF